jgi:hypothetical protein
VSFAPSERLDRVQADARRRPSLSLRQGQAVTLHPKVNYAKPPVLRSDKCGSDEEADGDESKAGSTRSKVKTGKVAALPTTTAATPNRGLHGLETRIHELPSNLEVHRYPLRCR